MSTINQAVKSEHQDAGRCSTVNGCTCEVQFPKCSLPEHLQSAFLVGTVIGLLRDFGEAPPYRTTVAVNIDSKWRDLTQYLAELRLPPRQTSNERKEMEANYAYVK